MNAFLAGAQKQGQHLIDSLLPLLPAMKQDTAKVKILNNLSYEFNRIDVDEGIRYGTEALELATKLHWKKGMATAHRLIGINYMDVASHDTAMENLEKSLAIFSEINDKAGIAKVYGNMGASYSVQDDRSKALEFHLKALGLNEDLKDERTIAANLSNIGVIYFAIGKIKDAIDMLERAVVLNKKFNNKTYLGINYHELGRFYESLKEYDKSFDFSKKAFDISKEIGDKNGMALGMDGMGYILEFRKDYTGAMKLYKDALQIRLEVKDQLGITGSLGTIALCYLNMAKETTGANRNSLLDSTELYCRKGIDLAKENENLEWQNINYNTIAEVQEMQGKYDLSLQSYKLSVEFKDSLFNADKRESIKNLEDKRAIELRDKQLKINDLEIDNRKKQQWLFIAGLGFLMLVGALLLWQNNNRKKTNNKLQALNGELVKANQTKARFFGILNHDLRSPVANLIQFLDIQKNAPELLDEATKNKMQLQTMTGAENLLQSMEDLLLWSKGQMQHFKPVIKAVPVSTLFENTGRHFYSTQHIQFQFEDAQQLVLNTDENYLLTIMRNLTGNAVKALQQQVDAVITWKAENREGKIILSVEDNGPGIGSKQLKGLYDDKEVIGIQSGLGLHLIRDLAKAIDCKIEVKSEERKGTVFTLLF